MKLDAKDLKEKLSISDIKMLLQELGVNDIFDEVDSKGFLITNTICHNKCDGKHKLYYYEESQQFHCYTDCGESFDIYELIQRNYTLKGQELHFSTIVEWVANKTGNSFGFGAVLKEKEKVNSEEIEWMRRFNKKKPVYDYEFNYKSDAILNIFSSGHHSLFLNDGINTKALDKYNIGYYNKADRITIPHRHWENGKIIGIKGRSTIQYEIDNGFKYIPIEVQGESLSFPTHLNLYGYYQNQEAIRRLKKVIIFESEKSVLQCETMFGENNFSVALSGSSMSNFQIDLILKSGVEKVIFAFDKEFESTGTDKELKQMKKVLKLGKKLAPYLSVYVLWDKFDLLELKDSPSDKGKNVLLSLMKSKQEIMSRGN